jgi:hypothetical protein
LKEFFEKLRLVLQPIEIDMEVENFIGHRSGDGAHAPFIFSFRSPDDSEGIIFKKTGRICLPEERTTRDLGRRLTASEKFHPERDPWRLNIPQKIRGRNRTFEI